MFWSGADSDLEFDMGVSPQLNVHTTQDSVATKQEDAPGRPGLTESKRHYLCTTSLLPRHSDRKTWINGVKETLSLYNITPAQAF